MNVLHESEVIAIIANFVRKFARDLHILYVESILDGLIGASLSSVVVDLGVIFLLI